MPLFSSSASSKHEDTPARSSAMPEHYGKHVFTGKVAHKYLAKHGSSGEILKDPSWVSKHADVVANAVFDW